MWICAQFAIFFFGIFQEVASKTYLVETSGQPYKSGGYGGGKTTHLPPSATPRAYKPLTGSDYSDMGDDSAMMGNGYATTASDGYAATTRGGYAATTGGGYAATVSDGYAATTGAGYTATTSAGYSGNSGPTSASYTGTTLDPSPVKVHSGGPSTGSIGAMDFSKSIWISELSPGVTIKRTVDGNEFVITGDGTTAKINGFPITIADYSKVLEGEKITVTADGKEVVLEAKDKKVMFDGKSFSNGDNISMESNTIRTSLIPTYSKDSLSQATPGRIDFSSSSWFSSLIKDISILRIVDGNEFRITGDSTSATINGFSVTPKDWESALGGKQVTLQSEDGKTGFLTASDGDVKLNGKSLIGGHVIQKMSQVIYNQISDDEAGKEAVVTQAAIETNDDEVFLTEDDEIVVEYEVEDMESPSSVGGDGSEAGSKTESLTTKSEAYSGADTSKTSLTTSPYPSTISALIKEKNCTEKDPEIMPGPVPSKGDSECRLPLQCGGREICTKENKCESMVTCETDEECGAKTKFPVRCEYITGDVKVCMNKDCEGDDEMCKQVGPEYRCFESQCKPTYGACESSCDCVDKYNMRKGEGKCHNKQCLCRTDWIDKCDSEPAPPPTTTTAKPPPVLGENSTPATTTPAPVLNDTCIIPPPKSYGKLGDPCSVQSACSPFGDLVCFKNNGSAVGSCQQIECKDDKDCSHGCFPMECGGGTCRSKDCSETFCPEGYGCYSDGQCKRIMGKCNFVCDCGDCGEMDCFKNQCFCDNNFDDCGSPTGYVSKTDPTLAGGTSYSKQPSDECKEPECPSDWVKTSAGCYKLLPEQSTFDEATAKCTEEKGFLAKVDSKKKMEELLKTVLKDGTISAWIGAKKVGETFKWILDKDAIGYSPSAYARIETDPAKACVQTISSYWQNSACTEKLPPLCEIATGKQGY